MTTEATKLYGVYKDMLDDIVRRAVVQGRVATYLDGCRATGLKGTDVYEDVPGETFKKAVHNTEPYTGVQYHADLAAVRETIQELKREAHKLVADAMQYVEDQTPAPAEATEQEFDMMFDYFYGPGGVYTERS